MDTDSGQDEITLHFSEESESGYLHTMRRYADNIVGEVNITGALTNPPSPFPRLRNPLSRITVDHRQLVKIPTLIEQQILPRPTLIQMSLEDIDGEASLRFTAGTIDSSTGISIPGIGSLLIGPSVSLSLDYRAFRQVLTRAPSQISA